MMNFVEYYPRQPIIIGKKDLQVLRTLTRNRTMDDHWLVVMKVVDLEGGHWVWKVSLLTSNPEGIYDFNAKALFEKKCSTFHEGLDMIKDWEVKLLEDRWFEEKRVT
ncbi:hypothetical protein [Thalassobacillus cyri]|nr:hypothetical protein [Thalassobacillus cyri]